MWAAVSVRMPWSKAVGWRSMRASAALASSATSSGGSYPDDPVASPSAGRDVEGFGFAVAAPTIATAASTVRPWALCAVDAHPCSTQGRPVWGLRPAT